MSTRRARSLGGRRESSLASRTLTAFSTIVAITTLTMVAGCSENGDAREYAIPNSLCGTPVNAKELTPFLPAGKKIRVREEVHLGTTICNVIVDRVLILTATLAWVDQGKTTAYFAAGQTLKKIEHSAEEGRFRFSDNEAFGKTRNCVDRRSEQDLYVALQAQGSDHSDPDAMKRLITSYTRRVEESPECTAGSQGPR